MKHILIVGLLTAAAALSPQSVRAQSPDCIVIETLPATIGAPGKYCLAAGHDVNMTTGAAITIAADSVTLDCRDHTVYNDALSPTGSSIGIFAKSRYDVLVRNCRIGGGFTDGIHITQPMDQYNSAFYYRVEDNYVFGPYRYGIVAYGSAVEVLRNRIWDIGGHSTGPAAGIRVGGAAQTSAKFQLVDGNSIVGTWSPSNHAYGILSDGSIASLFRGNTISGTSGFAPNFKGTGIRVAVGHGMTLRDNHIIGRGQTNEVGIHLPPTGSKCFHNHVWVPTPYIGCDTTNGNY